MEMFKFFKKKENLQKIESENTPAKEKITDAIKKYGKRGLLAFTLAVSLEAAREAVTPYSFEDSKTIENRQKKDQTSEIPEVVIYGHRDTETDLLLNIMTGKEDATRDYKWQLWKEADERWYEEKKGMIMKDPEDNAKLKRFSKIKYMTTDEYAAFSVKEWNKSNDYESFASADEMIDYLFTPFASENFDMAVYDNIWTLQQNHGNPEIRLQRATDNDLKTLRNKRAYYNPIKDRMYLPWLGEGALDERQVVQISDWIAELSHAKQMEEKPVLMGFKGIAEGLRILYRSIQSGESLHDTQLQEYDTEGSLENEAHSVIEEKLTQQLIDKLDVETIDDIGKIEKRLKPNMYQ